MDFISSTIHNSGIVQKFALISVLGLTNSCLFAYDFSQEGIYYNITSTEKMEVEITAFSSTPSENCAAYHGEIDIPESLTVGPMQFTVTRIGDDAFSNCTCLTKINIPKTISVIGQCAFRSCMGLAEINIPITVKTIEPKAFENCTSLTMIHLEPFGVSTISSDAFRGCSSLTSLTIPYGVTLIDTHAFSGCSGLSHLEISNSVTKIAEGAFSHCYGLNDFQIPGGLIEICEGAFEYCYGLVKVSIPASVTTLGDGAFRGCYGLKEIYINEENPNYIVQKGLVMNREKTELICTSQNFLEAYEIPNTVTIIHDYAFMGCKRLTGIAIPKNVRRIGTEAFYLCAPFETVEVPNSVISIGEKAFDETPWMTYQPQGLVYAGNVVLCYKGEMSQDATLMFKDNTVGVADCAFANCSNITHVALSNKLEHIGYAAFRGSGLQVINIPKNVVSIDDMAFCECKSLTEIHSFCTTVPETGEKAFLQVNADQCSLTIPAKAKELYASSPIWGAFKNIKDE